MSYPGPDTRVVELRVPGMVGISGEDLLDSVAAVTVAGDDTGEVIRPADRLRRPVSGPVLQALGRSLPRTLEGYHWQKMTSGTPTRALWALLFPFALANVAHGMLPPAPEGNRAAAAMGAACRGVLRIVGLLLTILLVTQLGVISIDLLAAQCLPEQRCLTQASDWLPDHPGVRMAIALLLPLLVIGLLHRVSLVSWRRVGVPSTDQRTRLPHAKLPGDRLADGPNAAVLRGLHTVAALAVVALLPLGGPFSTPSGTEAGLVWTIAVVLLIIAVAAVGLLHDTAEWPRRLFSPVVLLPLTGTAVLLVVLAGIAAGPLTERPGIDGTVEGFLLALLVTIVLFALLLAPAAIIARSSWRDLPTRLRPWLGGWAAAPTVILAGLTGAGFGAGLAISLREIIGPRDLLELPDSYTSLTVVWGAGTLIAVVLWFGTYFVALPLRKRRRGIPPIVRMLQRGHEQRPAADAWASSIIERKHLHRLVAAAVLLLGAVALLLVVARTAGWRQPGWLDPLAAFGVLALGLLAAGLVRTVYTAARNPLRGRHLGALADLVYLWPRRAHPIVPPSYALKVVPDLVERAKLHLSEPNTRVVVAGYSHGGLLALIAVARLTTQIPAADLERVGLVTAGTPAQWGYQRAFPAMLSPVSLASLYGALEGRWRGMCRGTDPFGGGVTTWRHQVAGGKLLGIGYRPDGGAGALAAAVPSQSGALVLGGDHWLPDPVHLDENGRRWAAGVLRHADYLVDPEWDRAVAIAAGLAQPPQSP